MHMRFPSSSEGVPEHTAPTERVPTERAHNDKTVLRHLRARLRPLGECGLEPMPLLTLSHLGSALLLSLLHYALHDHRSV